MMTPTNKEFTRITIVTASDNTCPICGKYVSKDSVDTEYVISGHGKFKRKQYYHRNCLAGGSNGKTK